MKSFTFYFSFILAILAVSCSSNQKSEEQIGDLLDSKKFKQAADLILEDTSSMFTEEQILMLSKYFSERTAFHVSIPLFRQLLNEYPNNNAAKLIMANNLRENGEYNEAIEIYNEVVKIDSIEFIVLPERARLYTQLEEFEKAAVDIERAKSMQPKYFAIFLADGLLQNKQGRQQEALDLFDVAIELDPGVSSEASLYAGVILLRNELNYDALGNFTKAIDIGKNINMGYAFINRGICSLNLRDTSYACVDWDSGYHYMPEQAKTYIDLYCTK